MRWCGSLVTKLCLTLATPWTVAHYAPLSMGFPGQEYWSGLPFPSPGNLLNPGIETVSPGLQVDSLPLSLLGSLICFTAMGNWASLVAQRKRICLQYSR